VGAEAEDKGPDAADETGEKEANERLEAKAKKPGEGGVKVYHEPDEWNTKDVSNKVKKEMEEDAAFHAKKPGKLSLDPTTGATVYNPEDKWTKGIIKPVYYGAGEKEPTELQAMTRKGLAVAKYRGSTSRSRSGTMCTPTSW
jgi:hypothetical protein